MTWRARAYLSVASARHLLVGAATIALSDDFNGDSFSVIISIFPLWLWGAIFVLGGIHLAYAAWYGVEGQARAALAVSAGMTAAWAAGFTLAYLQGGVVSPVGAILFGALCVKDLVQCAQPLRSPFEPLVRRYGRPPQDG